MIYFKKLESLLVLILKLDQLNIIKDFIPISLCNVVCKVIIEVTIVLLSPYLNLFDLFKS